MTNEEVKGHHCGDCDVAGDNTTTGKLLTRPQTAAPSLKKSTRHRLHRTESSLAIIGTERSLIEKEDIRKRIQSLASGASTPKQNPDKAAKLKGLKFRVKSAVSRVSEIGGVEQQNIPVVGKELLLTKSLSSPNFNTQGNTSSISVAKDPKLERKGSSPAFPKKDIKRSGLFISTEPITLATRPNSSLSISRKVRQDRPKTTSSLTAGSRNRLTSSSSNFEEKNALHATDEVAKSKRDGINDEEKVNARPTIVSVQPEEEQPYGLKTTDLRLALNLRDVFLDQDRDNCSFSNRTDQITSPRSKEHDANEDEKDTEHIYENIKSILRSRRENKGTARTNRSAASSTLNPVLPLERELPPVRSPSALSHLHSPSSVPQISNPTCVILSQNKENKLPVQLSPNVCIKSLESPVDGLKDIKRESSSNCGEHEKTISDDNVKTYKMARVEMYEKDFARHPKLSIADEIKKQNARLEEKNSELRLRENTSTNDKHHTSIEKDNEQKVDHDISPEKGNVCGSPGFKYYQEQLKSMSDQPNYMGPKRLGSGPRALHDTSKKGSGDAYRKSQKDKLGAEYKALGIRPLSDYTGKSALDSLFIAGGSCTFKNGEQAVSRAAENIATPAGVLSKVSLQQDMGKPEGSDSQMYNENGVKVRVSLTQLKEKQGMNPVGFRYRLDDYMSSGQPQEHLQQLDRKPKSALIGKQEYEDKKDIRKSAPALSGPRNPSRSNVLNDVHDSNDDSSSQASSSSTPTAAFSGSELLYSNDGVHRSHGEDLGGPDMPGYERDRQKLRDLEVGNRRPASRNKKMSVVDKVSFDRERDDLRTLNNSLPSKAPALRNGGPRNSLVRGEQIVSGRNGAVSNSNREPDDLIAMGTIWSPANNNNNNNNNGNNGNSTAQTRSSSNTTNSNKSIPINSSTIIGSNGFPPRKPVSVSMSTPGRTNQYSTGAGHSGGRTQGTKDSKEVEPKYSDPLAGAPASFQQRLMDLASLEADTIRWERTKRVKKKPKQDRDS